MVFSEAFECWIRQLEIAESPAGGARYVSPRTLKDLRQYARAAKKFFGRLALEQIHAGHLREYQRARATCDKSCGAWEKPAGANLIRKEVGTVMRVMRAAGAWGTHHESSFRALPPKEPDAPRALSPAEQQHWLHVAASRPEWAIVYHWSVVGLQTAAATNELRALRLGDVFLDQGVLQVRPEGAKNKYRVRTVPISGEALEWSVSALMRRAKECGAQLPHHYLFPRHVTARRYDPNRPMTVWGMRRTWDAVRAAAAMPAFTPYALRHTGATRMAESGMPIQVLMSLMGHVSPRMQQHYVAISMQAKRHWAAMAWGMPPKIGPHAESSAYGWERQQG